MKTRRAVVLLLAALVGLLCAAQPLYGSRTDGPIALPEERPLLKIIVSESAVITLTYDDLIANAIDPDWLNPSRLQLVHRGQPVALHWSGDGNGDFEPGEAVQFYAWAFDGSRYEKQFINENVFWLWSGDTPTQSVDSQSRTPHGGAARQTHRATLTVEPEHDFFSGWTDQWHTFPNEADAWYWMRFPQVGNGLDGTPAGLTIELPHPDPTGADALLTTEWLSRARSASPGAVENTIGVQLNESGVETLSWNGRRSINLTQTVPAALLQPITNTLTVTLTTPDVLYLNRATVEYDQRLVLDDAALTFRVSQAGDVLVDVGNTAVSDLELWQINDPHRPVRLSLNANNETAQGLRFWHGTAVSATYFLFNPQATSAAPQLAVRQFDPLPHSADWLAIAHPSLAAPARRLANYRTEQDGMSSVVIPINQIIDQFGYGLPLPSAITDFLRWTSASGKRPRYVVLFGDATLNPRRLECRWSCTSTGWNSSEATLVPTDLRFVDRFQGLIPTDQTLGMLDSDLLPDVMVGRIAAQTEAEADAAVSKIIFYETAVSLRTHINKNVLFLADSSDAAGDFCLQNALTATWLPPSLRRHAFCLPTDPKPDDFAQLNEALFRQINGHGAYLLNYRGHGSIQHWGGSGNVLLSVAEDTSTLGAWRNHIPTVILSADCLDGHFAWPGVPSVSETLLTLPNAGSAAHWSSTGLGSDAEHTTMHQSFYRAFQQSDIQTIGEAIRFAQVAYQNSRAHPSALYGFTLQGDPALKLDWVRYSALFLPLISGENE